MFVSTEFKHQLIAHLSNPSTQLKNEINQGLGSIVGEIENSKPIGPLLSQIQQIGGTIARWKMTNPSVKESQFIDQNFQSVSNLVNSKIPGFSKSAVVLSIAALTVPLFGVVASIVLDWS